MAYRIPVRRELSKNCLFEYLMAYTDLYKVSIEYFMTFRDVLKVYRRLN